MVSSLEIFILLPSLLLDFSITFQRKPNQHLAYVCSQEFQILYNNLVNWKPKDIWIFKRKQVSQLFDFINGLTLLETLKYISLWTVRYVFFVACLYSNYLVRFLALSLHCLDYRRCLLKGGLLKKTQNSSDKIKGYFPLAQWSSRVQCECFRSPLDS